MRRFQKFAEINSQGVLYEFAYFPHGVGESLQLKGCDSGDGFEKESFTRVGTHFAVFAEILIISLELIDCEKAADTLEKSIRTLTFLNPLSRFRTMLKS
jgi:hypothetical protein